MSTKVLVVDDEVEMATMLRHYLTRKGFEVATALWPALGGRAR